MPLWSVMVRLLMMSTKFEYFWTFVRKIFGRVLVSLFVSWVPFVVALLTHTSCVVRSHFVFVFRSCALGDSRSSSVQRSHARYCTERNSVTRCSLYDDVPGISAPGVIANRVQYFGDLSFRVLVDGTWSSSDVCTRGFLWNTTYYQYKCILGLEYLCMTCT